MSEQVSIYALCDPDGSVRYIGATSTSLELRLKRHLAEASNPNRYDTSRNQWLAALLGRGERPIIEVLEVVSADFAQGRERELIRLYEASGHNLMNGTHTRASVERHRILMRDWWARRKRERERGQQP